ncbi:hypothetical protein MKK64_17275 [Methylobacterium sp. E-025]|uniref:hypothetical protein n=1 Tax=Methylobacterium sp. E-025 TaxID=2836561 RepID=UPI001FBB0553|nr:hypothetical protein [Methylobacterium sp. E-025]MCJ2112935.1 hypothetical protein [Methylobacterium sp. E-025]
MTAREIAEKAAALKSADGDTAKELAALVEELAMKVAWIEGDRTMQLQTTAEGETLG